MRSKMHLMIFFIPGAPITIAFTKEKNVQHKGTLNMPSTD